MKKILLTIMSVISLACMAHDGSDFVASDILKSLKPGEKAALLMVHFGTTYDDTRAVTIDAINQKTQEAFPELEVREAYTARIVIRRLKERGVEKLNPVDALLKLKTDGFTHVLIQSSNIIDGVEMESLRKDIALVSPFFKEIRLGRVLLHSPEDYKKVVHILQNSFQPKGEVVLVGHGTYTPINASYSMLDYMLKDQGLANFHVGTVEGYPSLDEVLKRLKERKAKQVSLAPFMFVAGDHANNDIAGDWKEALEKEGYTVDVVMKGLGENSDIQDIFIDNIRFMMHHKAIDISTKKKAYAAGKDAH